MRKTLRVGAGVVVLLGAAGIGALIAAHSNPFPPGVEDPGVASTVSATPTPAESQTWALTLQSKTSHELFVGGSCTTNWSGRLLVTVDAQRHVQGTGQARLIGQRVCDFPNAQLQVRKINLLVQGQRYGDRFLFRLAEAGRSPARARDYGGFTNTVFGRPLRISLDGGGTATIQLSRNDDTGRGRFASSTRLRIRCSTSCG
jgi:hypothetical protein